MDFRPDIRYVVASYQGGVYYRTVKDTDTPVYLDTVHGVCLTEEEAIEIINRIEGKVWQDYVDSEFYVDEGEEDL